MNDTCVKNQESSILIVGIIREWLQRDDFTKSFCWTIVILKFHQEVWEPNFNNDNFGFKMIFI